MEEKLEKLSFKLYDFEGPLDLLLTLISKNKLDIRDISIAELFRQYMLQISAMKAMNMDIASEFLEMAARLIYIKTAMLLPRHEEADNLKNELIGELLEYRVCQMVAEELAGMAEPKAPTGQDLPQTARNGGAFVGVSCRGGQGKAKAPSSGSRVQAACLPPDGFGVLPHRVCFAQAVGRQSRQLFLPV